MPTIEFNIAKSKPIWKIVELDGKKYKKSLIYNEKIDFAEWVNYLDSDERIVWGNKQKTRVFFQIRKEEDKVFFKLELFFFRGPDDGYISVLLRAKNKENALFLKNLMEHFNAKAFQLDKEYNFK